MAGTERHCPECGTARSFDRVARTRVTQGTKVKLRCPECGYSVVDVRWERATESGATS